MSGHEFYTEEEREHYQPEREPDPYLPCGCKSGLSTVCCCPDETPEQRAIADKVQLEYYESLHRN